MKDKLEQLKWVESEANPGEPSQLELRNRKFKDLNGIIEKFTADSIVLKYLFDKNIPELNGFHLNQRFDENNYQTEAIFEQSSPNEDLQKVNNEDLHKANEADEEEEDDSDPFDRRKSHEKSDEDIKDSLKRLLMGRSRKQEKVEDDDEQQFYEDDNQQPKESNALEQEFENFNKEKEPKEIETGPFMKISNDSLSYERFYPGRILGNTFHVNNKSSKKITVRLSFTTESLDKTFVKDRLMDFYEVSKVEDIEQPYLRLMETEFEEAKDDLPPSKYIDSQEKFGCWYIEDPKTKSLVKEATLDLESGEFYEFIIVLKSPIIKDPHFLITNVKVKNITHDEEHMVFAFGSLDIPKLI